MARFGKILLANNLTAALIALIFTLISGFNLLGDFSSIGSFIAAIIVGLVTLRGGLKSGLFVLAFVALPSICYLLLKQFSLFDIWFARCVLVFIFALLARGVKRWSFVLEFSSLLGVLAVVLLHLIVPNLEAVWLQIINKALQSPALNNLGVSKTDLLSAFKEIIPWLTGLSISIILFTTAIQVFLARSWMFLIAAQKGFQREFSLIRVNLYFAGLFVVASLGLIWQPAWLLDLYPILCIPFLYAGLSFMHFVAAKYKHGSLILFIIYSALILLSFLAEKGLAAVLILFVLISFADSMVNLRQKLKWVSQKPSNSPSS